MDTIMRQAGQANRHTHEQTTVTLHLHTPRLIVIIHYNYSEKKLFHTSQRIHNNVVADASKAKGH